MPEPNKDAHLNVVWLIALIFIIGGAIWYFGRAPVVTSFFYIKRFEIHILSFFTKKLEHVRLFMLSQNPATISFNSVALVANEVGYYLRYPVIVILLLLAFLMKTKKSPDRYKETFTMKSLTEFQLEDWPYCAPTLNLNLSDEDISKGPWAVAMQPMQFAKKHKLVKVTRQAETAAEVLNGELKKKITLLRGKASKIFMTQLGELWTGVDNLKPHAKALYAVFAAKACRDSKGAQALIYQMAKSSLQKVNFSGIDELLKKYKDKIEVVRVTEKHAYVLTVMASMLQLARLDGVLSSAEFLWLKPMDRSLWFMLNAVGRQTVTVEVAGAYAHWLAEIELGSAIKIPMVEEATNAFEFVFEEMIYTE